MFEIIRITGLPRSLRHQARKQARREVNHGRA